MIAMPLTEVISACKADVAVGGQVLADVMISSVAVDSRKVRQNGLFVAINGENVDGHEYLESARDLGAKAAIVEKELSPVEGLHCLKVENSTKALGDIAAKYREKLQMPVISMTGSCGKTTTKEMLVSILGLHNSVSATSGNQNNELGVPLTLLAIDDAADFAVVEMGAAEEGDIAYLMHIANPDVVAVTNVSAAHIGRFGSEAVIAKTKGEIYSCLKAGGKAAVNLDDAYVGGWMSQLDSHEVVSFSLEDADADIYVSDIDESVEAVTFTLHANGDVYSVSLQVAGLHNVKNALCAAALAMLVGVSEDFIVAGLNAFTSVAGRFVRFKSTWAGVLVDDSYNANPASVKAAIDVLVNFEGRRILALGDLAELGSYSKELHQQVGEYARTKGIDQMLTVGVDSQFASEAFGDGLHFSNKNDMARYIGSSMKQSDVVLFKGSRSAGMETLVKEFSAGSKL